MTEANSEFGLWVPAIRHSMSKFVAEDMLAGPGDAGGYRRQSVGFRTTISLFPW